MIIPKKYLPDNVTENHLHSIKNITLLEQLLLNGWQYEIEVNLYEKKIEDTWVFVGLTLMADYNLWGRVYVGSMDDLVGSETNKFDRFSSYEELCNRIDREFKKRHKTKTEKYE